MSHFVTLPPPESFNANDDTQNASKRWKEWADDFRDYIEASGITDENQKCRMLSYTGGRDIARILRDLPESQKPKKLEAALEILSKHFKERKSLIFARYQFLKCGQQPGESIDCWLRRLKAAAEVCELGALKESLIRDQIVTTCLSEELRRRLLQEDNIELAETLKLARAMEAADTQVNAMRADDNVAAIQHPRTQRRQHPPPVRQQATAGHQQYQTSQRCYRCGEKGHISCEAARGKTCRSCGKLNHLAKACRQRRRVNAIAEEEDSSQQHDTVTSVGDDSFDAFTISDQVPEAEQSAHIKLNIQGVSCTVLVDSGASCNVMSEKTLRQLGGARLQPPTRPIFGYGSEVPLEVIGIAELCIQAPHSQQTLFHIVKTEAPTLLGRSAAFSLGILSIHQPQGINAVTSSQQQPIAFDSSLDAHLPAPQRLSSILQGFASTFAGIGCVKGVEVDVQMKPDAVPVCHPPSRVPVHLRQAVVDELEELLKLDVVERVKEPSAWVARIVVVPKANGGVRICQDLRDVNKFVIPEKQPIPTFEEITDEMAGSKIFSELDVAKAFHQISVAPDSRHFFTFSTPLGLIRLKRLSMGFANASEILQRVMSGVLLGLEGVKWAHDDITVFAPNIEEHNKRLSACLQRLHDNGITLNASKCHIARPFIDFLGMRISAEGVQPATEKTKALKDFKEPNNATELRSFLGLATYLARFVQNFADVTHPLRELLKKGRAWSWQPEQRRSFEAIKTAISSESILAFYDTANQTEVIVDASPVGVGAILSQTAADTGHRRPIAFASRALSDVEQRYSQIEREALAVKFGCLKFEHFLCGSAGFTEVTDHRPLLQMFRPGSRPPPRIERMALRLQHLNFEIIYRPGAENPADILSRQPLPTAAQNVGQQLDALYVNAVVQGATPKAINLKVIQQAAQADTKIQRALMALRSGDWNSQDQDLRALACIRHELSEAEGLLLKGSTIVVPTSLQRQMLQLAHAGHQCWEKTFSRLQSKVWWRGMRGDCEAFVRACPSCLATAGRPPRPPPLHPTPLPDGAWLHLGMDFCGPVQGKMLLVITDHYSKFPEVQVVSSTSNDCVQPHLRDLFSRFGVPLEIVTDNGPPFNSAEFKAFLDRYGVRHRRICPLHPQANGATERLNRCINKVVRAAIAEGRNWRNALDDWLAAYRTTPHSATGVPPVELLMGRRINDSIPSLKPSQPVHHNREALAQRHAKYTHAMARTHDATRRAAESVIEAGTQVLRKRVQPCKTQTPFETQPWQVVRRQGDSYQLQQGQRRCRRHLTHILPVPGQARAKTADASDDEDASDIATRQHPRAVKTRINYKE
jgi:hypothetical protein